MPSTNFDKHLQKACNDFIRSLGPKGEGTRCILDRTPAGDLHISIARTTKYVAVVDLRDVAGLAAYETLPNLLIKGMIRNNYHDSQGAVEVMKKLLNLLIEMSAYQSDYARIMDDAYKLVNEYRDKLDPEKP